MIQSRKVRVLIHQRLLDIFEYQLGLYTLNYIYISDYIEYLKENLIFLAFYLTFNNLRQYYFILICS